MDRCFCEKIDDNDLSAPKARISAIDIVDSGNNPVQTFR